MLDANEYYLHQYLSSIEKMDAQDAWVEGRMADLMKDEFNPATIENMTEAFSEMSTKDAEEMASHMKAGEFEAVGKHLSAVCHEYWAAAAEKQAINDYDDLEPDFDEGEK